MIKQSFSILKTLINPEDDWSSFLRKISAFVISVTLGVYIYEKVIRPEDNHQETIDTIVSESPEISNRVKSELQRLYTHDLQDIESVWLYSWSDELSFRPLYHVGGNDEPLKVHSFMESDTNVYGRLAIIGCGEFPRNFPNRVCGIKGPGDVSGSEVLGFVIIKYKPGYNEATRGADNLEYDRLHLKLTAGRISDIIFRGSGASSGKTLYGDSTRIDW